MRPRVLYDREKILAEAERGALLVHAQLSEKLRRFGLTDAQVVEAGKERVERALAYAEWRMAAHDAGEVDTPW